MVNIMSHSILITRVVAILWWQIWRAQVAGYISSNHHWINRDVHVEQSRSAPPNDQRPPSPQLGHQRAGGPNARVSSIQVVASLL